MNAQANTKILPSEFQDNAKEETTAVELPKIDTVGHVLRGYAPLALMLCNQINFMAGTDMMRRLNADAKKRTGKTDQDIHPDTTVEDEFASVMPEQHEPMPLEKSTALVGASLVLANRLSVDDTSAWMKQAPWIRSPKQIIVDQVGWVADKQAETRRDQAIRFGLVLEASTIRAKMEGEVNERVNHLYADARSAYDSKAIMNMETDALISYLEENYDFVKDWADKLKDRVSNLFERNVKKLQSGGYADMDDTLIALAQSYLKK